MGMFPRAPYRVRVRMGTVDLVLEVVYCHLAGHRWVWLSSFGCRRLGRLHGKYGFPAEGDFVNVPLHDSR